MNQEYTKMIKPWLLIIVVFICAWILTRYVIKFEQNDAFLYSLIASTVFALMGFFMDLFALRISTITIDPGANVWEEVKPLFETKT